MSKKPRENRVPIMMSDEELSAIDDWRFANRIATRSDAVRRLVQIGLRFEGALSSIDEAASGLATASDTFVNRFYLKPDRDPDLSEQSRLAMKAMRTVMRRAQALIEATASIELQRDHLADAAGTMDAALKAADETLKLFSDPYPSQEDEQK